jgi:hypothetical protein
MNDTPALDVTVTTVDEDVAEFIWNNWLTAPSARTVVAFAVHAPFTESDTERVFDPVS